MLASAGFGSRRQCEELIEEGRVDVDGDIVTKLGTTVDPDTSKIRVDGVLLKKQKLVYFAVNKPIGVVTTNSDPQGRPRVVDLVPHSERVFPVGRLDRSSEGLILLTNDGDLAQKLTHPKFGVRKVYRVTVAGKVTPETMKQMRQGIYIAEGRVSVEGAKILKARGKATEMEIVLREGKNREIRRILARLGHKVQQLRRIAVGPLRLGDMPPGAYRIVSREEVKKLHGVTQGSHAGVGSSHAGSGKPRGSSSAKARGSSSAKPYGDSGNRNAKSGGSRVAGRRAEATEAPVARAKRKGRTAPSVATSGLGESRKIGAVIGADPAPTDEVRERKKTRSRDDQRGSRRTAKRSVKRKSVSAPKRKPIKKGSRTAGTVKAQRGNAGAKKRVARKRKR